MREYHEVFGHELPPLPQEPVLSDFYTPTDEQHYRELGFIVLSMIEIGGVLYHLESYITNHNVITFWLPWDLWAQGRSTTPYRYISILQHLQPEPIDFAIPNQLHPSLY